MRLLARDDPHPRLFDHYRRAVQLLASAQGSTPWVLRAFELVLLREIGLLPDLAHEGSTLSAVQADRVYALDAENGLRLARADEAHTLLGEQALLLQAALDEAEPDNRLWAACAACEAALRQPLRHLLHYHSGVQVFKTRQLMLDVQALNRASP
jgi:DNA repair protein RecO (recombination protein O)